MNVCVQTSNVEAAIVNELARWGLNVSLRQTASDVRARNAGLGEAELMRLVDEELGAVREQVEGEARF